MGIKIVLLFLNPYVHNKQYPQKMSGMFLQGNRLPKLGVCIGGNKISTVCDGNIAHYFFNHIHLYSPCEHPFIAYHFVFCYAIGYGISGYNSAMGADYPLYNTRYDHHSAANRSGCWRCHGRKRRQCTSHASRYGKGALLCYDCRSYTVRPFSVRDASHQLEVASQSPRNPTQFLFLS